MIPWNTNWLQAFRRTTSSGQYLAEIDGLRFLAILPVLVQHLSERLLRSTSLDAANWSAHEYSVFLASRGTVGVFLFFAISGFILCLPFAKYWSDAERGSLNLKAYFLRRLTRLEPPYIIWMTVFFMVLLIKGTYSASVLLPHYIASIFYLHNGIYNDYSWINPVAWSLEVEVQFYLLAPILTFFFFSIRNKNIRRITIIITVIAIVTLQQVLPFHEMPWKASLAGQLQHFLAGFLLADFYLFDWKKTTTKTNFFWDMIGLAALSTLPFTWSSDYSNSLLFSLALVLVLVAAFKGRLFKQFLQLPIIAIIGGMCYTIYLIHLPLMELLVKFTARLSFTEYHLPNLLLQMLLVFPIILVLSAFFFRYLEKPFMNKNWVKNIFPHSNYAAYHMKKVILQYAKNIFITILCSIALSLPLLGQSSKIQPWQSSELLVIRPVEDLIAEALQHSPLLKIQDIKIEQKTDEAKLTRRKWADYFQLNGNYQFGNGVIFDAVQTTIGTDATSTDRTNVYFNVGASVRLPIGDLWTRGTRLKIAEQTIEIERLTHQQLEFQIREAVIQSYQQLQTSLNVVKIKMKEIENRKLTLASAEKYFRDGTLSLSEYNEAVARLAALEEAFEKSKGEVMLNYWNLKQLTGTSVDQIKN